MRGRAYYKLGQNHRAINDYTKAIQLDPDDAWAYLMRSLSHRSLGNITQADATQADADKAKACSFDSSEVRKFCVDD